MFSRTHFMGQRPWTRPLLGQTEGLPPAAPAPAPGAGPAPMPTVPLPTQPPVGQTPGTRPLNVTIQLRRFPVVVLRPMTFGPRPLQPKTAAAPGAPAPPPPRPAAEHPA